MKRYVVNIRQWPRTAARRARMKTEQSTRKPLKTPAHAAPVGRRLCALRRAAELREARALTTSVGEGGPARTYSNEDFTALVPNLLQQPG